MSFKYTIENNQVKIMRYTGATKNVILPNFITTIAESAFFRCKIETLVLNEGLKYIGCCAFEENNLSEIVIPQTVEFVGVGALRGNKRLTDHYGDYREATVKILNPKALIIDKYNHDYFDK